MTITLGAPWLAHFHPQWFSHSGWLPPTPQLDLWLRYSRSETSPVVGSPWEASFPLFGVTCDDASAIPWAALSALGDGIDPGSAGWLRIDPVHLRPDMARLRLFSVPDIAISSEEAAVLAPLVSEALEACGDLTVAHPERWYLQLTESDAVVTTPLHRVVLADMEEALPRGDAGASWRRRINEIQMRLFECPLNQQREAQGAAPINGVWVWGMGTLPRVSPSDYQAVFSDSPVVRGLALASGIQQVFELAAAPDGIHPATPGEGEILVWCDVPNPRLIGDPNAWAEWLESLETRWIAPLMSGLEQGRIDRLALLPGDGTKRFLKRSDRRRFWRRGKSLAQSFRSLLDTPA